MNKKTIYRLAYCIIGSYLSQSFVRADINPMEWDETGRVVLIMFSFCAFAVWSVIEETR